MKNIPIEYTELVRRGCIMFTEKEAAGVCGVHPRTIKTWRTKGVYGRKLTYFSIGKCIRIPEKALNEFIVFHGIEKEERTL